MPMLRLCAVSALVLASSPAFAQDAFEPDDAPANALPVTGNLMHTDRSLPFDGQKDIDRYRFNPSGPTTVVIETNRRPVRGSEEIRVSLVDANDNVIEDADDTVAVDVGAGTFYGLLEADLDEESVESYDVGISIYPATPDRFEPNNTLNQAKPLTLGVLNRFLSLSSATDEDWFVMNPGLKGGSDSLPVVIQATSAVRNLTFTIFDANGFDETPFTESQNEITINLTPGNHYLRVTNYDGGKMVPSYTLTYWAQGGPDPYEDDDTPETASASLIQGADHTPAGHQQYRSIFPLNDEDWVRFYVEDADFLSIVAPEEQGSDPLMELYDATGTTLLAGPETFFLDLDSPPDGFYLARFRRDPGQTYNEENLYRISISTVPIPRFTQGTLAGLVTAGTVLSGATIEVLSPVALSTRSGGNGTYLIDALPQGAYSVRASANGLPTLTKTVQVGASVVNLNFDLSAMPEDLNGDSQVNAVDVQLAVNGALGIGAEADVNGDGDTNAVDVQLVINAALGL